MDTTVKDKRYICYTEDEATEKGIIWKYWRDCEPGDWGISDDYKIGYCKNKRQYANRRAVYIDYYNFTHGKIWGSNKFFSAEKEKQRMYDKMVRSEFKVPNQTLANILVTMITSGTWNWRIISSIMYKNTNWRWQRRAMQSLRKNEEVLKMVETGLKKALEAKGITESSALDLFLLAEEKSKNLKTPTYDIQLGGIYLKLLSLAQKEGIDYFENADFSDFDAISEEENRLKEEYNKKALNSI